MDIYICNNKSSQSYHVPCLFLQRPRPSPTRRSAVSTMGLSFTTYFHAIVTITTALKDSSHLISGDKISSNTHYGAMRSYSFYLKSIKLDRSISQPNSKKLNETHHSYGRQDESQAKQNAFISSIYSVQKIKML